MSNEVAALQAQIEQQHAQLAQLQLDNKRLIKINEALIYRVEGGGGNQQAAYSMFEHSVQLAMHVNVKTKELNAALEQVQMVNHRLVQANEVANFFKQRFEDAIESISEAFVLLDGSGTIVYLNSIFRSFWQNTDFMVEVGTNYYDLKNKAKRHRVIQKVLPTQDGFYEYHLNNQRWYRLTERPTDEGGTVLLFTDITAMKQAEDKRFQKAIAQQNKQLQSIVDNLEQGIVLSDERGKPEIWNKAFLSFTQLRETQLKRCQFLSDLNNDSNVDLIVVGDMQQNIQILEDNTVLAIKVYSLSNGKSIRTYSDISESYYYSETLKENEKWLRTITDNVPAMIAYIGRDKHFQFTNKVYNYWYSKEGRSLVGMPLNTPELFSNYGLLEPYIDKALSGHTVTFETEEIREGDIHYLQKSYVPNFNQLGEVDGFFVMTNDISERKKAGNALRLANEQLEHRVQERTRELQLANESKSKFLAAVSHDLLQPLNAAQLFINSIMTSEKAVSVLQKHPQERAGHNELLNSLQNSLFDLENLIVTLVDISKLDAGVVKPDKTIFPVEQLLNNIAADYGKISSQHNVSFNYVRSSVHVESDSLLLARVLRNYLSNAVRHANQGKVLLGCRRKAEHIVIEVWDNGDGIAKDDLAVIFEEFKRLKQSYRAHQSLGLGLAIVDKMAKVLAHDINVKSEHGKGSCFSISVPIAEPQTGIIGASMMLEQTIKAEEERIWVVDNDEAICLGMRTLLSQWGFKVTTALSLQDLESKVDIINDRCDLVIVDYHLDDANGFDVVKSINKAREQSLPSIMITANYSPELQDLTKSNNITLINKPIKPLKLKMSMRHLLSVSPA